MFKIDHKKAQAATELAVFGAILIFIIGSIVRSALSNSYTQNQDFKAMQMAMLASWNGSKAGNAAHNSASILFVEDRLSPDFNKYGDLDRTPFIAMGSGSFSYEMMYPVGKGDLTTVNNSLPVMDVYINGQHFPLTEAAFEQNVTLQQAGWQPGTPVVPGTPAYVSYCEAQYPPGSNNCKLNQCLRSNREWVGGYVEEGSFISPSVAPATPITNTICQNTAVYTTPAKQAECQEQANACAIFTDLSLAQMFSNSITISPSQSNPSVNSPACDQSQKGYVNAAVPYQDSCQWNGPSSSCGLNISGFVPLYEQSFPNVPSTCPTGTCPPTYSTYLYAAGGILNILNTQSPKEKLFYSVVANPGPLTGATQFSPIPPSETCQNPPCPNQSLTSTIETEDYKGNLGQWNSGGDMMYDLQRMGNYGNNAASPGVPVGVENTAQFGTPLAVPCAQAMGSNPSPSLATMMRCWIGWQWAASAGVSSSSIGLVTTQNQYPSMDIDGRLKPVTIYQISSNPTAGTVTLSYEDFQNGDIDQAWDTNSCGPKPGLQSPSQVMTFTNGTYLLMSEGKLYNPETGQVVRSANKRDNVDLIQRSIQLSTNTHRFCDANNNPQPCVGGPCTSGAIANPVEVCVNENPCTCFMGEYPDGSYVNPQCKFTLAETCYDTTPSVNTIFVRSRLQDLRGRFWMTDTSGQLKVH